MLTVLVRRKCCRHRRYIYKNFRDWNILFDTHQFLLFLGKSWKFFAERWPDWEGGNIGIATSRPYHGTAASAFHKFLNKITIHFKTNKLEQILTWEVWVSKFKWLNWMPFPLIATFIRVTNFTIHLSAFLRHWRDGRTHVYQTKPTLVKWRQDGRSVRMFLGL